MPTHERPSPVKRRLDVHRPVLVTVTDAAMAAAGLGLAYGVRFHTLVARVKEALGFTEGYTPRDYVLLFPLAWVCLVVAFYFVGLYGHRQAVWGWQVASRVVKGTLLAVALFLAALFFLRPATANPLARWMVPISFLTVWTTVSLGRWMLHVLIVVPALRHGHGLARALVLGVGATAREIGRTISNHPEYGWRIVGAVSDNQERANSTAGDDHPPVLGNVTDLSKILGREAIEAVFVAGADFRHERLGDLLNECEKQMVDVKIVPDLTELLFSGVVMETLDGIPFLGLRETPLRGWSVVAKRAFDLVAGLAFLAVSAPVMAVVTILVRWDSPGSVFYRQKRVGADGRGFFITKFRTMRADAEAWSGPVFSTPDDPRQTRVGRVLRQLHLDELPQLFNVVRGDMSLVGPRPERPFFVEQFREEIPRYMARHRIKSGMTGLAQVNGQTGHEGTIAERLRYDLYYIENWSIFLDLRVLLLTVQWVWRRMRQMATLPPDHSSLRRVEAPDLADETPPSPQPAEKRHDAGSKHSTTEGLP
jgi:exopolysaccharide biosynthesis polyprenyl glycosylphosphotransferase